MPEEQTRIGLLGAGYILGPHARALKAIPSVKVAAVCDLSRARAEEAAGMFGIPETYTSLDEMLRSSVDIVHVLLPPDSHEAAAERILKAGKGVFLEKPMGLSSDRCRSLASLAEKKGVRLGVNHNFLFGPAYESLRPQIRGGALGKIDHLTVDWLYKLGSIQSGPYGGWMFREPRNLLFELAPHAVAFLLDLLGQPDDLTCRADDPIGLSGGQRVYRHWTILGVKGRATCAIHLSVNPGQPDRSLFVRGSSAVARVDYERGVGWIERAGSGSALFDDREYGLRVSREIRRQSLSNFRRRLWATLGKAPGTDPFLESVQRSIAAFYRNGDGQVDPRLSGAFGAEVIRLCERAVTAAGVSGNAPRAERRGAGLSGPGSCDTLVVGGTGFIGKRLVAELLAEGRSVRVLTRSRSSAELELAGLPVDIAEGRHDDPALLDRVLPGVRTVYHLAKATGEKWSDYYEADVKPTNALADASIRNGVRRFVYTGTIDSYYSADPSAVITGDTPLDPRIGRRNHYARSKALCEAGLLRMRAERGLPLVILRPGIVIGKGSPPAHWGVGRFVSDSLVKYWGDGENPLPFVLVDDVARALALAGTTPGIEGRTFLLTDRPMLTAREYVGLVQRFSGTEIRQISCPIWRHFLEDLLKEAVKNAIRHPNRRVPSYRDWACRAHRSTYDSSATMTELGWKPVGDKEAMIEQGIKASVEQYLR